MGKFNELDLELQEYVQHLQQNYDSTASGQFIEFTYEIGRKYAHVARLMSAADDHIWESIYELEKGYE